MAFTDIWKKCAECGVDLICNVPAGDGITRGGGGDCDVKCPSCEKRITLDLPGKLIHVWVPTLTFGSLRANLAVLYPSALGC